MGIGNLLLVPEADYNLLGRDLIIEMGINIEVVNEEIKIKLCPLRVEDEEKINSEVWYTPDSVGRLNIPPFSVIIKDPETPIRVKQYPISPEGKNGLKPEIERLLSKGLLESCMSPFNTPILPIKKADGSYRLVHDLREINKRTVARFPVVANRYTLLSRLGPEKQYYSVIDLKDAFWACPLDEKSRDYFAFEWEDPVTHRRQQLRWTVLPQGFTESPNLFGQALEQILQEYQTGEGVTLIQYVDDLLIAGEAEDKVQAKSIRLLNFLTAKGLKVSKAKLQFVEEEVKYLGHYLRKGEKKIDPERVKGILSIPPPKSKKQIRQLLGLMGYCRQWIENYSTKVKFLYKKLSQGELVKWHEKDDKHLKALQHDLVKAPVLSLPDLKRPFYLFVNTDSGTAYGVLTQEWAGKRNLLAEIVDCTCRTRLKGIRCDTPPVKYRNWDSYVKRQQSRPRGPPEEYPCCREDGTPPVARGNRVDGKGRGGLLNVKDPTFLVFHLVTFLYMVYSFSRISHTLLNTVEQQIEAREQGDKSVTQAAANPTATQAAAKPDSEAKTPVVAAVKKGKKHTHKTDRPVDDDSGEGSSMPPDTQSVVKPPDTQSEAEATDDTQSEAEPTDTKSEAQPTGTRSRVQPTSTRSRARPTATRSGARPTAARSGNTIESFSLKDLRGLRKDYTRRPDESIISWLVRLWDAAGKATVLDGTEARHLGSLSHDPVIDQEIIREASPCSLWERVLGSVAQRYLCADDLYMQQTQWKTIKQEIQCLREMAVAEIVFSDDINTRNPDLVPCTPVMWRKLVQLGPQEYSSALAIMKRDETEETVLDIAKMLRTYADAVHGPTHTRIAALETRMRKLEDKIKENHKELKRTFSRSLQYKHVREESVSIAKVTGGSQDFTLVEADVSLTGNEWKRHPIVTGPEAPCILGIDFLRNGYFKDPRGFKWAFEIAAVETEGVKQLNTLPRLSENPSAVGLLKVEEQQVPIATSTVHRRQYRTTRDAVIPIHEIIRELETQGVVSKTHSPFNSPIWPVRKSDGRWRLTVDYRALNQVTPPLSAAVPDMLELQYELESKAAKWYATIDIANAFFSIPLAAECRPQFAFTWRGVQYTWNRLPQGWKHSPTICHGLIQAALEKSEAPEHLQYINDIIV
ncbi:hypothetical protein DUI87_01991 [Hirundo rustica rustica]|uniref:ribonuclease H n=1 Tax=Hirundo rustica rustica TaxID=333673 RepID=A0A3M0L739_HIRRU|nr:hypothetical protein DUI87_01991 [Hirundo rustica rustica]